MAPGDCIFKLQMYVKINVICLYIYAIMKIMCPPGYHHNVLRHKNLQKQREEQITNNNIPEANRPENFFGSYLNTPEIID